MHPVFFAVPFVCPTKIRINITEDNDGIPGSDGVGLSSHFNIHITPEKQAAAMLLQAVIKKKENNEFLKEIVTNIEGWVYGASIGVEALVHYELLSSPWGWIVLAIDGVVYCSARCLEHYQKNIDSTHGTLEDIIKDPPDFDYTTIFYEEPVLIDYPFDKSNKFLESLYQVNLSLANLNQYLEGLLISQERFLGAYIDGNKEFMQLQATGYDLNLQMFLNYLYNFTDNSQFLKNINFTLSVIG